MYKSLLMSEYFEVNQVWPLSKEMKASIKISEDDIREGRVIDHYLLMKEMEEWLNAITTHYPNLSKNPF